ncbi:NADP-dependent oxidoreductase [Rhodococcus sp. WB9]|uniref:NADP-dependent oxidoreductase n=1 Tax=Rhodococcus sp. WB9 TaxID=2594007 RepID=UPI001185A8F1|nr:NADP-dependent oxidoreductase [Rhodococcus sp. WB9]QDQ89706.1 NADP-dependent oxidoreductase [Rhodococcus sp. WB9]
MTNSNANQTMKAVSYSSYGGPEVLETHDVPVPEPTGNQVRLVIRAAGVNPIDWKLRSGSMAEVMSVQFPKIPGSEVAGVVDAVGPEATGVVVGDEVFGWSDTGGYAEYALASIVVPKPKGLSWTDAASIPVAGEAATRGLRLLKPKSGETLLVNGASGAVGTIAAQLALDSGVTVIGTASEKHHDALRELGVTPTTYGEGLADRVRELAPNGVDAVLDVGFGGLEAAMDLRGGTDRIVTLSDGAAFGLGITFSSGNAGDRSAETLRRLGALAADGKLALPPARTFPLTDAADAQRAGEKGGSRGKILLR